MALLIVSQNIYASETIRDAEVLKLHVYKNARTMVELDKGADIAADGCTHDTTRFVALTLLDETNNSLEEMYAALLSARIIGTTRNTGSPISQPVPTAQANLGLLY